jgi:predicted nucleic acid-binding protein
MWGIFMGQVTFRSYLVKIYQATTAGLILLLTGSMAQSADYAIPDINSNSSFRTAVHQALKLKEFSFIFSENGENPRRFIIDYDTSFLLAHGSRENPDEFEAFLNKLTYRTKKAGINYHNRNEYVAVSSVKIQKDPAEELPALPWKKDRLGHWALESELEVFSAPQLANLSSTWKVLDNHPSFVFFITALDLDEEDEEEAEASRKICFDARGNVTSSCNIRFLNLVRLFRNIAEAEVNSNPELLSLKTEISNFERYPEEAVIQRWTFLHPGKKYEGTPYQMDQAVRDSVSYMVAMKSKLKIKSEILLQKKMTTSAVIDFVKQKSELPEIVILEILLTKKMQFIRYLGLK